MNLSEQEREDFVKIINWVTMNQDNLLNVNTNRTVESKTKAQTQMKELKRFDKNRNHENLDCHVMCF